MKVLGLVVEYNPFHNGHLYHIEQSKKATGCDAVVCVMSGNFIQRGEPAVINKFARTEAAVSSGADLVIELPVPFAAASAEFFGFGAVKILDSLGIIDCISFGSEHGDIGLLLAAAEIFADEPPLFKQYLGDALNQGLSFPVSRQNALVKYFDNTYLNQGTSQHLNEILGNPNNILGIEYLKALKRLGSSILPSPSKEFQIHITRSSLPEQFQVRQR
jgi:predicted nucleotidyltransferase